MCIENPNPETNVGWAEQSEAQQSRSSGHFKMMFGSLIIYFSWLSN